MEKPTALLMFDIESLAVTSRSVVTQIGLHAVDINDPDTVLKSVEEYLPIQPQIDMGRAISADTILFWMAQPDAARNRFKRNAGDDLDEMQALVRSIVRKTREIISESADYEIWARGPQFDIVNLESLIVECGESVPWEYNKIRDLRSLMALADIHSADVEKPLGFVQHVALWDCKFQVNCYVDAIRRLRSRT